MVLAVSLLATAVFFVLFWVVILLPSMHQRSRSVRAGIAAATAAVGWTAVVLIARQRGWVETEESTFHHLYVLAVVGLPVIGLLLAVVKMIRPPKAWPDRARMAGVALAFMAPAAVGVWATHIEPNRLTTKEASLDVAGVDETLIIGVLADIQTDRFGDFERQAIEEVMAGNPDIIVVAGDMTQVDDDEYAAIEPDAVEMLSALDAPFGVFMIQGNTDPSERSVRQLAELSGITPLLDEIVEVDVRGERVRLGGLRWPNNRRAGAFGLSERFADESSTDTIDILLSHSPDGVFNLPVGAPIDLIISGHTHGGQISIPFYGPIWNVTELPNDVAGGGLHDVRGMFVYVSTGIGVQRGESPKVRLGVTPAVDFITIS